MSAVTVGDLLLRTKRRGYLEFLRCLAQTRLTSLIFSRYDKNGGSESHTVLVPPRDEIKRIRALLEDDRPSGVAALYMYVLEGDIDADNFKKGQRGRVPLITTTGVILMPSAVHIDDDVPRQVACNGSLYVLSEAVTLSMKKERQNADAAAAMEISAGEDPAAVLGAGRLFGGARKPLTDIDDADSLRLYFTGLGKNPAVVASLISYANGNGFGEELDLFVDPDTMTGTINAMLTPGVSKMFTRRRTIDFMRSGIMSRYANNQESAIAAIRKYVDSPLHVNRAAFDTYTSRISKYRKNILDRVEAILHGAGTEADRQTRAIKELNHLVNSSYDSLSRVLRSILTKQQYESIKRYGADIRSQLIAKNLVQYMSSGFDGDRNAALLNSAVFTGTSRDLVNNFLLNAPAAVGLGFVKSKYFMNLIPRSTVNGAVRYRSIYGDLDMDAVRETYGRGPPSGDKYFSLTLDDVRSIGTALYMTVSKGTQDTYRKVAMSTKVAYDALTDNNMASVFPNLSAKLRAHPAKIVPILRGILLMLNREYHNNDAIMEARGDKAGTLGVVRNEGIAVSVYAGLTRCPKIRALLGDSAKFPEFSVEYFLAGIRATPGNRLDSDPRLSGREAETAAVIDTIGRIMDDDTSMYGFDL